ncbi:hypothetical protein BDQ12DRAFT_682417 [Crucibulum laeve]|uniref:Uncharacterized protein n=1 Tax=Crucibulum laeve TaxID=68775 RepID=A0A5C3M1G4_9AGAR|nr:hypothetical protein BDQ12DRAFT_682417 [Crucibulum laeve]
MDQLVDLTTAPKGSVDFDKFSLERHRLIVIYKTAYYFFYLPVAPAMYHVGLPRVLQRPLPLLAIPTRNRTPLRSRTIHSHPSRRIIPNTRRLA